VNSRRPWIASDATRPSPPNRKNRWLKIDFLGFPSGAGSGAAAATFSAGGGGGGGVVGTRGRRRGGLGGVESTGKKDEYINPAGKERESDQSPVLRCRVAVPGGRWQDDAKLKGKPETGIYASVICPSQSSGLPFAAPFELALAL
jgi:hypothetical protein